MREELGAIVTADGVQFSLFSAHAERVELCLFDSPHAQEESSRIELQQHTDGIWRVFVRSLPAGTAYGYRVHGPYAPELGHRFNPAKIVFDPYARAVARSGRWDLALCSSVSGVDASEPDRRDSAPFAPLAAVADAIQPWSGERLDTPWHRSVIYELHVKGMTQLHPLVPEKLRGSFLGLSSPAVLQHLQRIGVTAVELLPIHFHFDEPHLVEKGLTNYWGYSTLGYFCADPRFAIGVHPSAPMHEFREMVRSFHEAGIEVLIDVVFNHTCEGGPAGPTLSFRGIDNSTYYRLEHHDKRHYVDYTGCGNSIDTRHPQVVKFVLDSLRYWVSVMGVDGFRFDLAPVLGRDRSGMDPDHGFFRAIAQDKVLSSVKLIAEPWDLGTYQLGQFPISWLEWNGQYRDTMRSFWRSDRKASASFATRLAGSSDLFGMSRRGPQASINFITCHDGFPLRDLVSYEQKNNLANLEDNRDGNNDNRSWNCGVEGETENKVILELRLRQQKNFLMSLFLSAGVPMLLGGDEVSRSQGGNNNSYCQDNELSWFPWDSIIPERDLRDFVARLAGIRLDNPTLRRVEFFHGTAEEESRVADISWWLADGTAIGPWDWGMLEPAHLAVWYGASSRGLAEGEVQRRHMYFCVNPSAEPVVFQLPKEAHNRTWHVELSAEEPAPTFKKKMHSVKLKAHSSVLLVSEEE